MVKPIPGLPINGDDNGKLRPLGAASRAEAAQLLMAVIENILPVGQK